MGNSQMSFWSAKRLAGSFLRETVRPMSEQQEGEAVCEFPDATAGESRFPCPEQIEENKRRRTGTPDEHERVKLENGMGLV